MFWFRAPIALTGLLLLRGLPREAAAGAASQRFDIAGALLLASGLAALLLAINALPRLRDGDYLALLLFPAACVSLVAFVWWEAAHAAAGRAGRAVPPRSRFAIVNARELPAVSRHLLGDADRAVFSCPLTPGWLAAGRAGAGERVYRDGR